VLGAYDPHGVTEASVSEQQQDGNNQHNLMDTISHPNQFFELSTKKSGLKLEIEEGPSDGGR
jgi:hypothetical protein